MKLFSRNFYSVQLLLLLLAIAGCRKAFEYSPYSSDIPERYKQHTTDINRKRLLDKGSGNRTSMKIAVLSDTHNYLVELREAIEAINGDSSIDFVVFGGDYSDQGLLQEYLMFHEELQRLDKPFFTLIGNHEYLAKAADIYRQLFGEANYTIDHSGFRFVFFDDVFWEKDIMPDFDWLEMQLAAARGRQLTVIAHIAPDGDQFDSASRARYEGLMQRYKVGLSISGHFHSYLHRYVQDVQYLTVPSPALRQYCTAELSNSGHPPVVSIVSY